jgi:hypothetical protein
MVDNNIAGSGYRPPYPVAGDTSTDKDAKITEKTRIGFIGAYNGAMEKKAEVLRQRELMHLLAARNTGEAKLMMPGPQAMQAA